MKPQHKKLFKEKADFESSKANVQVYGNEIRLNSSTTIIPGLVVEKENSGFKLQDITVLLE